MSDLTAMALQWQFHKTKEHEHQVERRKLEDEMARMMALPADLDETRNMVAGDITIKVIGRVDRKVDADKVQEIAAEHGLEAHLSTLFRWKPEVNMRAWNQADAKITGPLAQAITAKPGRPSFSVHPKKEQE